MSTKPIMIIEDDPDARKIFTKVLNHRNYETATYARGDDAMRFFDRQSAVTDFVRYAPAGHQWP